MTLFYDVIHKQIFRDNVQVIYYQSLITKVWPEMSEIMTFLDIASAEKIGKIPLLASIM